MVMTPRQRWLALLHHKAVDRIPMDYQATVEVTSRLLDQLHCESEEQLWRTLDVDRPQFIEPARRTTPHPDHPQADMWGVRFEKVDYGTGAYDEPVFHPLADVQTPADVHRHRWPKPDDFDYAAIDPVLSEDDGYRPIHCGCYEPFLLYGYLRGLQRSFEDLVLRPKIADAILGHIFDFFMEHHRRCFEAGRGRIDLTWVAEDLGSQTGPLFSLETYRRFLLPNQIKMADLARTHGVHVMYHTDGAAGPFLPDLTDRVGIELLNPIQWRCPGMERERLVADFGDRIIFHGSIDNQQTLPFGSPPDVIAEVRESVEIYRNARWICGPCHNIQPITPTENILAMYRACAENGREDAGEVGA
jgi:uroporphyrinogen decarboxylase